MEFSEIEEKKWICSYFDNMMKTKSIDEKKDYIFKHPLLLTLKAKPILIGERGQDQIALTEIQYLDNLRQYYWKHPEEYPIGYGPIEKIQELLGNGQIQFEEAKQKVRDVNYAGLISPLYMKALMLSWVDDLDIDINFTMKSAELAVEAVIAMPMPDFSLDVRMQTTEGYIRLAHGSLLKRPDGQVYNRAIALGQWSAGVAKTSNNYPLRSVFLHEIGTLSLDAYAANFGPNEDYPNNIDIWIARTANPMPSPGEGLENARIFLQEAIPHRDKGSSLGLTLKALLETIIYEAFYTGVEPDITYLLQLSGYAKDNLDQYTDSVYINRVNELMGIFI